MKRLLLLAATLSGAVSAAPELLPIDSSAVSCEILASEAGCPYNYPVDTERRLMASQTSLMAPSDWVPAVNLSMIIARSFGQAPVMDTVALQADTPVPEPLSIALIGTGMIGIGLLSSRRRRKK